MMELRRLRRTTRVLSSIIVLSLLTLTQATAGAAPPQTSMTRNVVIDVTSGLVSATCGFPVHLHTEGFFKTIAFTGDDGNTTRQISQAVFHGSLSANGKSIPSKVGGPEMLTFNADGSVTLTILGVTHRNVPGAGHVGSSAGRFTVLLTFDENGQVIGEELVQQAGLADPLADVCAYLAPDS
jgi:hypothetical protein